jgi:hypothetical protein
MATSVVDQATESNSLIDDGSARPGVWAARRHGVQASPSAQSWPERPPSQS